MDASLRSAWQKRKCHSERSEESIFGTACLVWIASVALRPRNDAGDLMPQSLIRPTVVIASQSEESILNVGLVSFFERALAQFYNTA